MTYIHFFGIDVSQDWFDVALHEAAKPVQYSNDEDGFAAFLLSISALDPATCFVVLEATGGYESRLLQFLIAQNICVHRAAPLHVKYFIRSLGRIAKTDKIDAWALARYGAERHQTLSPYVLPDEKQCAFNQLMMRRNDLVAVAAAEKNRAKQPRYKDATPRVKRSVHRLLEAIEELIAELDTELDEVVETVPAIKTRIDILRTSRGIGRLSAYTLQAYMPELGTLTRRTAASLAGCAPHPRDSGLKSRKRTVFGGRGTVRRILFLAAMAARRYDPNLKAFYEKLVANGKPKMVALTALMRKIIVISNAKLRTENFQLTW